MSSDEPRISPLGTSALLFEAPGATELATQRRIWALAAEAERWPEVREAVPGMNGSICKCGRPQFGFPAKCERRPRLPASKDA